MLPLVTILICTVQTQNMKNNRLLREYATRAPISYASLANFRCKKKK